jgi:DNA-binding MarR family transcriptional regulator/GNAT superfamily N-acetyltransferase
MSSMISSIRHFNRYYTNLLGVLDHQYLKSQFSLSEIRVLYEIDQTDDCTLTALTHALQMDGGYLSRILKKLEKDSLVQKQKSSRDGRSQSLSLTEQGQQAIDQLNRSAEAQIDQLIRPLSHRERSSLVKSMTSVETTLSRGSNISPQEITLRTAIRPGDIGTVIQMHGQFYGEVYGYSLAFEGYIAGVASAFSQSYQPERDRLWCAEHNGKTIGTIAIVDQGESCDLRWFLLDELYRGIGLGKRLLREAIVFARETGYRSISLVTTEDLLPAMGLYESFGFVEISRQLNPTWKAGLSEVSYRLELG